MENKQAFPDPPSSNKKFIILPSREQLTNIRHFSTSALFTVHFKYRVGVGLFTESPNTKSCALKDTCKTIVNKKEFLYENSEFASYLAGLIEANGSIIIDYKNSNPKYYQGGYIGSPPKILVVFNLTDESLAKNLANFTEAGAVYTKKNAGYVL